MTVERELSDRLRVIGLFDTYGRLLTAHQQRLLALYYHDDLSLGEIARRLAVTRQAVFDTLRRSTGELERLEAALQVVETRARMARASETLAAALDRLAARVGEETVDEVAHALGALRRASRER